MKLPKVWDTIKTHWTLFCMILQVYNNHKKCISQTLGKGFQKAKSHILFCLLNLTCLFYLINPAPRRLGFGNLNLNYSKLFCQKQQMVKLVGRHSGTVFVSWSQIKSTYVLKWSKLADYITSVCKFLLNYHKIWQQTMNKFYLLARLDCLTH